jgi:hypothetical protein
LSRKFAGGDATIREAAAAGGDVAREVLKKLNRRHLEHLSRAPQHAQDKPPPPLNDLEGAVARVSLDDGLDEDEETLRTLGDQPVLIWHRKSSDPPELDLTLSDALTPEEDIPRWAARVTPAGCRPVGGQMHEIRRYDGDAEPVIAGWAVGGEAPPVPGGLGGGGKGPKPKGGGSRSQAGGKSAGKAGDAKRGQKRNGGGKEKEKEKEKASGDGAKARKTSSRGAARPRARAAARVQTRKPKPETPLSETSTSTSTPDASASAAGGQTSQTSQASQPRGGGRASAFGSFAGDVAPRRMFRFAAGIRSAPRRNRVTSVGFRAAAAAAARGAAFAFL